MDHNKSDQIPHAQAMPGMHILTLAKQRDHPAKQRILPASLPGTFTVKRKACEDHKDHAEDEEKEHAQLCQRVVTDVLLGRLFHKQVPAYLVPYLFPPGFHKKLGEEQFTGMMVPYQCPVQPADKAHGYHVSRGKVGKANVTHQEIIAGFPR